MFIKITSVIIVWIIYFTAYKLCYPISTNDLMQYQMTNNPMSTSGVELQMTLWNWAFLLPLGIAIFTFLKEIKNTINKIIENIKESDK